MTRRSVLASGASAVMALLAMIVAWAPPVSGLLGAAAVTIGEVLPRGRVWTAPGPASRTGPPDLHDAANLGNWLTSSAWLVVVGILTVRAGVWWSVGRLLRHGPSVSAAFAGWRESLSAVAWCAVGAAAWRFAWGLSYDRLVQGRPSIPVAMGGIAVVALWMGAALGHALIVSRVRRRTPQPGECASCGYAIGAPGRCPECGVESSPTGAATPRVSRALLRSWCAGLLAAVLLASPYAASWLTTLVPLAWLDRLFLRLPQSW